MKFRLPTPKLDLSYLVDLNRALSEHLFYLDAYKTTKTDGVARLQSYTVATAPTASDYEGGVIYVSDETGGATLCFSDGTNWRRVQDRVIMA